MSDITKKIFSIEPDIDDIIEPITKAEKPVEKAPVKKAIEPLPKFITRQEAPLDTMPYGDEAPSTKWITVTGIVLTVIWIGAVTAYIFALSEIGQNWSSLPPMGLAGILMAIIFPAILISLLWMTWRRLAQMKHQAQMIANIAKKLTKADDSAIASTQNLADGIRAELSKLDQHLEKTLDRYSTLQVQLTADTRSIDEAGLILTERAEDVGRNLTLQRQALESISGTFDSKMETLTASIAAQSQDLTKAAETAAGSISAANEALTQTSDNLKASGEEIANHLQSSSDSLNQSAAQLENIDADLSKITSRLQEEQTRLQTEMNAQVKEIGAATGTAIESSELLMNSLRSGQDTVAALNTATLKTNESIKQQFEDLSERITTAQSEANDISEKAATRVQESLSQTRRDLSQLETDMLALQAKLRNASQKTDELGFDEPEQPLPGIGRLKLKPLDTDFPPVEPPRFQSKPKQQAELLETPLEPMPDQPLNLGMDMEVENEDNEITDFDPDILRRPAPVTKSFGRAKRGKKEKSSWHWRDMLGGLDSPSPSTEGALDIVGNTAGSSLSLNSPNPDGPDVINYLRQAQLAPSAIIDDGTIIEASKSYVQYGAAHMQGTIANRIGAPCQHLRDNLNADTAALMRFKRFTDQFNAKISAISHDEARLRTEFGTAEGRAFLLSAAALRQA